MSRTTSWIVWGLAAVLAAGVGFWTARQLDSSGVQLASGTWLPGGRELRDFSLVDHTGAQVGRAALTGRPSLVFFGFTHCPDVCPMTLALLARVRQAAAVEDLRLVLVSVDPERDSPEALARYVAAFDTDILGLTGEPDAIRAVAADFGVAVVRVDMPGDTYTVDHSAAVFLLDRRARLAAVFTPPFDAATFAADLRHARAADGI
jgi:protein SCO1